MSSKIKVKYPIAIRWKIPEIRLQELRNSIDECLESCAFNIPDTDIEYCLSIRLNGDDDPAETEIYLCLDFEEKKEIEAEYSISIDSANYSKKKSHIFKRSYGWGGAVCTTDELFDPENHFFVDDEIEIKLEGFLVFEKDAPDHLFQLGSSGHQLSIDLWNEEPKDFTFVVEEKKIRVHKLILSKRSPVLAAMIQHAQEAQENEVIIPVFTFEVVETAIKFCYDSSLVENVSFDNQISLLLFFDKYEIQLLKTDLEEHLVSQVNEFNVCRLANCALLSNAPKLLDECMENLIYKFRKSEPICEIDILDQGLLADCAKKSLFHLSEKKII